MAISYISYEDDQLVACMREGDHLAFAALYQRYGAVLLNYAVTITENKEEAADILQEIFVSLWNRRAEVVFSHSLKAWLYQAVRFQAARYINRSVRKRDFLEEITVIAQSSDLHSPERVMVRRELDDALKSTINNMPARMREVFILSREAQLSHREISHKLNIAESTVKKTVQNALRFIRERSAIDYLLLFIFINFF